MSACRVCRPSSSAPVSASMRASVRVCVCACRKEASHPEESFESCVSIVAPGLSSTCLLKSTSLTTLQAAPFLRRVNVAGNLKLVPTLVARERGAALAASSGSSLSPSWVNAGSVCCSFRFGTWRVCCASAPKADSPPQRAPTSSWGGPMVDDLGSIQMAPGAYAERRGHILGVANSARRPR